MDVMTLATIPSPPQGVWMIGGFPLRGYALSILTGIIIGYFLTRSRYRARGGDPEFIVEVAMVIVPAGIIGGRLYHLITDWQLYWGPNGHPGDWWKVTNGGLGILGAVALGAIAAFALCRFRGVPFAPVLDAAAPAIVLAQGIGRLGNWFNQELYGRPTDVPWGLEIYRRVNEAGVVDPVFGHSTGEVLTVVHPTFLYELIWDVALAFALIAFDRYRKLGGGRVFALYLGGYGVGRFFVELMRADPANHILGLRINTITSTLLVVAAVAYLLYTRHKNREEPSYVRGRYGLEPDAKSEL